MLVFIELGMSVCQGLALWVQGHPSEMSVFMYICHPLHLPDTTRTQLPAVLSERCPISPN